MSTTSRRIAQAVRKNKPSRTRSSKARVYVAIPPAAGWPAFDGQNWVALGVRRNQK